MDKLLNPDTGLMVWTVVTFLLLVLVLTKAAWKPILDGLNLRETKIKSDLDRAEKAQAEAENLRVQYESRLAEAQKSIQDMIKQARKEGEKTRSEIVTQARKESEKIILKGRKDLEGETEKLKGQLQEELGGLSVQIAEKILSRSVDSKVQEEVLKESLKSINGGNGS